MYADRLAPEVCSVAGLERWLKHASEFEQRRLFFEMSDLVAAPDARYSDDDFPPFLEIRGVEFPVRYRFAPGEADDGVSVEVPVGLLNTLVGEALEWSVPGFFGRLAEQWLRTLPKLKRRQLAPMPEKLADILPILLRPDCYRQGRMLLALAGVIGDQHGVRIQAADWDRKRVDAHLLVNVRVLDGSGRILSQGRDLEALKAEFAGQIESRMSAAATQFEQAGLVEFPHRPVPATMMLDDGAGQVIAYPALADEADSVGLKLFTDARQQRRANQNGYARLALLAVTQTTLFLKKTLEKEPGLGLQYASLGSARQLADELLRAAAWQCFFDDKPLPQTAAEFAASVRAHRGALADIFGEVLSHLKVILQKRFEIVRLCDGMTSPAYSVALADVREQLEALVPANLLTVTPHEHLGEIPRYLDAIAYRLAHLQGKVSRDEEHIEVVHGLQARVDKIDAQTATTESVVVSLRFTLQELRVSLFAEPLGVKPAGMIRGKISLKRVDKKLSSLERELGLI